MKLKTVICLIVILTAVFAVNVSAKEKICFQENFTAYSPDILLTNVSEKWSDFNSRGFTQWKPYVTADPENENNKVLAIDKFTSKADNKNEHLKASVEKINGQITSSMRFYIPSAKLLEGGKYYNSAVSDKKFTVGVVDSANAANYLVYADIIPNTSKGASVYSHGQTKAVSKDEWHTLKMTVDTETGIRETYLDGELLYSSSVISAIQGKYMGEFRISAPGTLDESIFYADDIKVTIPDTDWDYMVNDIIYSDGNVYLTAPEDGAFLKTVNIEKSSSADGNGMLVAAGFNKYKELETVKFSSFKTTDFNGNKASVDIDLAVGENTDIKIFIWDKSEKINPLADAFISEKTKIPTLYLIGDSTMETYTESDYPRAGLGQMTGLFFDGIDVVNYGSSGKTTQTYLEYEGWTKTLKNVKCGDYVIIQLGINDAIYAVGTDVYRKNLKTMTDTLLGKGVNVIVNTPTVRRMFENGKFRASFGENGKFISTDVYTNGGENYYNAVKSFIAENSDRTGFFSVDMTDISATLIGPNAAEDDSTRRFYMQDAYYNWDSVYAKDSRASGSRYADKNSNNHKSCQTDHTHLTIYGATVYAQKMAEEIAKLDIPVSEYVTNLDKAVLYPDGLSYNGTVGGNAMENVSLKVTSEIPSFGKENIADSDPLTYWQSDELPKAEDNGLSLFVERKTPGERTIKVGYKFPLEKNILIYEHDILVTDVVTEKSLPYFLSSGGRIALTTAIKESRLIVTGSTVASDIKPDTWYNVKYVINVPERKCDVYVDGKLKLSGKSFREDAGNISEVQYHLLSESNGSYYVDNIKITRGDGGEVVLSENFESYKDGATSFGEWTYNSDNGTVAVSHYDPESKGNYPQDMVIDFKKIGYLEEAEITFPFGKAYKFDVLVSKDGKAYTHIAQFTDKYYGGKVNFTFSPVSARYMKIHFLDGQNSPVASISEVSAKWQRNTPEENLAFSAKLRASSQTDGCDKRGVNDNIISCFDKIGEWRPLANDKTPYIEMSWDEPQSIDRIVLYGSVQQGENIRKGLLIFSDGSRVEVSDIPESGKPLVVDFAPKTVTSVRFAVTEYEKACALSEMQVYPTGEKPELAEYIEPWKVVTINEDYGGKWIVSADIDNDGEVELISCRSQSEEYNVDNHEVRTACAMELDGSIIWTWGVKGEGVTTLGADSPCQVYDINNDGIYEVLLCTNTELVILNAKNGQEEKRYTLPTGVSHPDEWASDCILIANISGNDYPSDIIVKSRYNEAWAFTKDWELIWHVSMPGGMNIGHQPLPVDIDNDGYDEVMVGYSLVNPDGTYRWIMDKNEYGSDLDGSGSHCDSVKILPYEKGAKPEDIRICLCLCGSCDIVMIDGNGKRVWAAEDGMHYETILTGKLMIDSDEAYIVSNPNIARWMNSESGNQPIYVHDIDGNLLKAQFGFDWNRKPSIVNWSGNEDWIYMPADGVLVDINMNIMARTLSPVRGHDSAMAYNISRGSKTYNLDFNGDGRQDLANLTDASGKVELYIYLNENGKVVADDIGSGYNISFY